MDGQENTLLEMLYSISRDLASALDLRTVLQRVLYAALEHVGGERGTIVVMDDTGNPVDATIVYGGRVHDHTTRQLRDTIDHGLAGWVVRHRQAVLIPDTSKDERWLQRPDDQSSQSGAKSAICVPLMAREKLVGVLTLVHPEPNAFEASHLDVMQAIADQAGIVVLNARLYAESQRQARVMTALVESALSINTSLRLDEVLQHILEQTNQALQVEDLALALLEDDELVCRRVLGPHAESLQALHIPAQKGVWGHVLRENRGVVVNQPGDAEGLDVLRALPDFNVHRLAIAPLRGRGGIIGLLVAINPLNRHFDPDALLVLSGIGSLAGSTIENAQLFERLDAAHRRYRELFENSIDPILLTDLQGRIMEANRMALTASGYSVDALREMAIDQLHEVNWAATGLDFELVNDTVPVSYESTLFRSHGTLSVEVHVQRVHFENELLLQWIFRDITERKELDALRNDLTSMIYHDLRSPLGNIVSSLDMLERLLEDQQDETVTAVMRIANHSIGRIQRLLNSLLDINRLEAGQPVVSQDAVSPAELVQDAVSAVMPQAGGRRQIIEVEMEETLPSIWADDDMVRRVLINLLENAIKFSPLDASIMVGARRHDAHMALFWVRDSGPGIPDDAKDMIFDKFKRLNASGGPKGLGVGLAFCRLAVTGHGGKIWVENNPDQGSTFFFTLPFAAAGWK